MGRVVLNRLTLSVPLLLGATLLAFLLLHWAPGSFVDPLRLDPRVPASVIEELERRYGLDRPWPEQYLSWLFGLVRGDLGTSASFALPVRMLIAEALPRTLALAGVAHAGGFVLGLLLGLFSVERLHGAWDRWASRAALILASVHPIVLAIAGMGLVALSGVAPVGGGSSLGSTSLPWTGRLLDFGRYLALPAAILVLVMLPGFYLQARGAFAELLQSPFVRAARARGVSEPALVLRHVLRPGLVPLLSFAGASTARLLNGAFLVEVVTGWPGMGRLALRALEARDAFLLLATLVFAGVVSIGGTLIADVLLAAADPRIRLEEGAS